MSSSTAPLAAEGYMSTAATLAIREWDARASVDGNDQAKENTLVLYPNFSEVNFGLEKGSPVFLDMHARDSGAGMAHPPVWQSFNGICVSMSLIGKTRLGWTGMTQLTKPADKKRMMLEAIQYLEDNLVCFGIEETRHNFQPNLKDNGSENGPVVRLFGKTQIPGFVEIPTGSTCIWRCPRDLSGRQANLLSSDGMPGLPMPGRGTKLVAEIVPWDPNDCYLTRDWARRYCGFDNQDTLKNFVAFEYQQQTESPNHFMETFVELVKNIAYMTLAVFRAKGAIPNDPLAGGLSISKALGLAPVPAAEVGLYHLNRAQALALNHQRLEGVPLVAALLFLTMGVENDSFVPFGNEPLTKKMKELQLNSMTQSLVAYEWNVYRKTRRIVGKCSRGCPRGEYADLIVTGLSNSS